MAMKPIISILTAGLLADGCTAPAAAPSATGSPAAGPSYVQPQPSAAVRDAQQRLTALGFYTGTIDGFWGPETQAAVERFQRSRGLQVTGDVDQATATALQAAPPQPSAA